MPKVTDFFNFFPSQRKAVEICWFSLVCLTNPQVAIKIVDKTKLDDDNLRKIYREIEVMKKLAVIANSVQKASEQECFEAMDAK